MAEKKKQKTYYKKEDITYAPMHWRVKDKTNQQFGRLKVLGYAGTKKKKSYWWCECKCGNIVKVRSDSLGNPTKSCGCLHDETSAKNAKKIGEQNIKNDIFPGDVFGRLKVIKKVENERGKDGSILYECKCDCGNIVKVPSYGLRRGDNHSCGCLNREHASKIGKMSEKYIKLGEKFGKLTVLEKTQNRSSNGSIIYKCKCDCGSISYVTGTNLRLGKILSCGCINSKGEEKISQILSKFNILFNKQKTFDSCRFPNTNSLAKFDFYIPEQNYLIEFDGIQHFLASKSKTSWNTEDNLKLIQERDEFKNNWCKENNIPLIRIPYTHLNNLCIEDLKLETSRFIYKGEVNE